MQVSYVASKFLGESKSTQDYPWEYAILIFYLFKFNHTRIDDLLHLL